MIVKFDIFWHISLIKGYFSYCNYIYIYICARFWFDETAHVHKYFSINLLVSCWYVYNLNKVVWVAVLSSENKRYYMPKLHLTFLGINASLKFSPWEEQPIQIKKRGFNIKNKNMFTYTSVNRLILQLLVSLLCYTDTGLPKNCSRQVGICQWEFQARTERTPHWNPSSENRDISSVPKCRRSRQVHHHWQSHFPSKLRGRPGLKLNLLSRLQEPRVGWHPISRAICWLVWWEWKDETR